MIFTEGNYRKFLFRDFIEKGFLKRKRKLLHNTEISASEKNADRLHDPFEIQRMNEIREIVSRKDLTNQEKLAAYAFFSRHHGSEMNSLLSICIDNYLPAEDVIRLFESDVERKSYESMKAMLLALSNDAEARIKQQFVSELISGSWTVQTEIDGVRTEYRLVAVKDQDCQQTANPAEIKLTKMPDVESTSEHSFKISGEQESFIMTSDDVIYSPVIDINTEEFSGESNPSDFGGEE